MKIGQITWWRNNYGSILQSLALQEKLRELGYNDCEIICQYGKKVTSINNLLDKIKTIGIKGTVKKVFGKYTLSGVRKRTIKMEHFVNKYLKISKNEYNEQNINLTNNIYDAFICGSDQIWNPSLTSLDSFYWLNFVEKNKLKIAYAPSVGINKFSDEEKYIVKNNLKSFDGISCRENSGTSAINDALSENKCITVLDPTLIVDKEYWNKISNKRKIKEKYIFTYLLRGTKKQRKEIEKFAKENNLIIVTIPFLECDNINFYDFKFGDIKIWDADPSDFVSLIRYAEYVFTDSFHSMIFSTIYHKDFYTFPKIGNNQQNRLLYFQESILNCNRMLDTSLDINENIKKINKIDWQEVDNNIKQKKRISDEYLKKFFIK